MKLVLATLLVGICVVKISQAQNLAFSCLQPSGTDICKNGGKCTTTGACDCSAATGDYMGSTSVDCSVVTSGETCAFKCGGDQLGTCYVQPDATELCSCIAGYIQEGEECVERARIMTCTDTSMTFFIDTYGEFEGTIAIAGFEEDLRCQYNAGAPGIYSYQEAACGGPLDGGNDPAGKVHEVEVIVQYSDKEEIWDQKLKFTCTKAGDGGEETKTTGLASVNARDPLTEIPTISPSAGSVDIGLQVTADPAVVNVGDELVLTITLLTTQGFSDFHIESIYAQDSDPPTQTEQLVANGCYLKDAKSYLNYFKRSEFNGAVLARLGLKTFKFFGKNTMMFSVKAKVCEVSCSDLVPPPPENCDADEYFGFEEDNVNDIDGESKPFGKRRKRQVSSKIEGRNLTVSTLVIGSESYGSIFGRTAVVNPTKECMKDLVFILPLIILSVMLIVSVMVAVYFCLKVSRSRSYVDQEGIRNLAYK